MALLNLGGIKSFSLILQVLSYEKSRLRLKTVLSNLAEDEVGDIAWVSHNIPAETFHLTSLKNFMPLLRVDPLHQILVNIPYLCSLQSKNNAVWKQLIIMAFKSQVSPETEGEAVFNQYWLSWWDF